MIKRYYCNPYPIIGDVPEEGHFVLYEDHLKAIADKEEAIAGLETEILRLQGIIGQFSGLHEALMQNIEGYDKHLVEAIKKYIPRKE
jgi:hypothetical protein